MCRVHHDAVVVGRKVPLLLVLLLVLLNRFAISLMGRLGERVARGTSITRGKSSYGSVAEHIVIVGSRLLSGKIGLTCVDGRQRIKRVAWLVWR